MLGCIPRQPVDPEEVQMPISQSPAVGEGAHTRMQPMRGSDDYSIIAALWSTAGNRHLLLVCTTDLEPLRDINLDLFLLCPLEDLAKHNVCNLLNLSLGQLSKNNDLVQPTAHQHCISILSQKQLSLCI